MTMGARSNITIIINARHATALELLYQLKQ